MLKCGDGGGPFALAALALRLHEMHGNVYEWCEDTSHTDYEGAPTDGSAWTTWEKLDRVLRGGSWDNDARLCRAAFRNWVEPTNVYGHVGFRLARSS